MKKSDKVYISPTGLQAWLECPAKLRYSQAWERKEQEDNFGSQAHRHMENNTPFNAKKDFPKVEPILRKLRELENQLGYTVLGREVEQSWELFPNVVFKRILDAVVRLPTGRLAIVDYKSSSKPWKTFKNKGGEQVAPKARTLQAAGYMLPPPEDAPSLDLQDSAQGNPKNHHGWIHLCSKNWPGRVLFLNGPESGDARWFMYERNEDDEEAFRQLAAIASGTLVGGSADYLIKNRGDQCDGRWTGAKGQTYGWACPWLEMCWEQRGWTKLYQKRKR